MLIMMSKSSFDRQKKPRAAQRHHPLPHHHFNLRHVARLDGEALAEYAP